MNDRMKVLMAFFANGEGCGGSCVLLKQKFYFLILSYHPYKRECCQSSIAPSVGQSRETSVAVDYSTWGYGGEGVTPMATYGQAALCFQDA